MGLLSRLGQLMVLLVGRELHNRGLAKARLRQSRQCVCLLVILLEHRPVDDMSKSLEKQLCIASQMPGPGIWVLA